jgi:hypothetical protein
LFCSLVCQECFWVVCALPPTLDAVTAKVRLGLAAGNANRTERSGSCGQNRGNRRKSRVEQGLTSEVDSPNLASEDAGLGTTLFL